MRMARSKYVTGDQIEMKCPHLQDGVRVVDWVAGVVVQADYRMAAVRLDVPVFVSNGLPVADNILWAAHGSSKLRLRQQASVDAASDASEGEND